MSYELRIGLLAAICIAVTVWGYKFMKGKNILNPSNFYYVVYEDVDELAATSPVLIRGLRVGTVAKVSLSEDMKKIIATLDINKGIRFPKNTSANIVNTSIMGGKAVVLTVSGSCKGDGCASRGDTLSGTVTGFIESMIGPDELNHYWGQVKEGLGDVVTDISDSLSASGASNEFAKTFRALQQVLVNLESLTRKIDSGMNGYDSKLQASLGNMEEITANLAQNNSHISSALASLDTFATDLKDARLSQSAASAMENLDATMTKANAAFTDLQEILAKVNTTDGTLGKLVNDKELYENLSETSNQLALLLQDMRLNPKRYVNVSVFGKKQKEYELPEDDPADHE